MRNYFSIKNFIVMRGKAISFLKLGFIQKYAG
jgi:hypothetical protein